MLNHFQINRVWENMIQAETRALYFADLSSRFIRRKQWITAFSFFLSSGAAATLIGNAPKWIAILSSLLVAASTAYAVAFKRDGKAATMAKLHSSWSAIASDYDRLWNNTFAGDAEEQLYRILKSEKEPSELAALEAPNDQALMGKWQDQVFRQYHLPAGS